MDKHEIYCSTVLGQTAFFRDLNEQNRLQLASCCQIREESRGTVLFREMEEGLNLFLLLQGRVQLHKLSPDGQEVVVKVVRPGELFAEVVLFERAKYPVTAVTLENVQLLEMPRVCVRRLLGKETFRDDFIAMLIARQRYLAQRLMEQQSYDVEERLVLFLREQYGEVTEIQTALSKKAIAAAISTTPETLSRVIRRLQDRGVLTWSGRAIHLPESFWAAYRDVG